MSENYFVELNSINVNDKIEKKNGLSYLSWAYAWGELKKRYPDAIYTIYENSQGWNYHTDGRTAWVKVSVTVNGVEHVEELPIMDYKNKSIALDNITSFEVNKSIQRALTKAVARHGLGLYIYAGEDLPDETDGTSGTAAPKPTKTTKTVKPIKQSQPVTPTTPPEDLTPSRTILRDLLHKYKIEPNAVLVACNLTQNSSEAEWSAAVEYVKKTYKLTA